MMMLLDGSWEHAHRNGDAHADIFLSRGTTIQNAEIHHHILPKTFMSWSRYYHHSDPTHSESFFPSHSDAFILSHSIKHFRLPESRNQHTPRSRDSDIATCRANSDPKNQSFSQFTITSFSSHSKHSHRDFKAYTKITQSDFRTEIRDQSRKVFIVHCEKENMGQNQV
jgi:hypothetical protein